MPRVFFLTFMRLYGNRQISNFCCIAIPGLTRNPALFERVTQLDAGSSPA
jgi:hypothetical protein